MSLKKKICDGHTVLKFFREDFVNLTSDKLRWVPETEGIGKGRGGLEAAVVDGGVFLCQVGDVKVRFRIYGVSRLSSFDLRVKEMWESKQGAHVLMVVPKLQRRVYDEARVLRRSCLDLNGRVLLCSGPLWVEWPEPFQDRFRCGFSNPRVFSGMSARFSRALLAQPARLWTIRDLAAAADLHLSHAGRLKLEFAAQGWLAGILGDWHITSADRLLNAWREADRWPRRVRRVNRFKLVEGMGDWERFCGRLLVKIGRDRPVAFTRCVGAVLRSGAGEVREISVYTRFAFSGADLEELGLVSDPHGDVALLWSSDEAVCSHGRSIRGIPICSDAQIYLDFYAGGPAWWERVEEFRGWSGFLKPD